MSWHPFWRKRRDKRGSINFDFSGKQDHIGSKGKPIDVAEYERNNAHRIIEEFMLAANQTVAEDYYWQELPFVYRTHEAPDSEKILQLGYLSIILDIPLRLVRRMKYIQRNCKS